MSDPISSAVSGTIYALHNGNYHFRYVGATLKTVEYRLARHAIASRSGDPRPLYDWFRRFYGSIRVEVLETCGTREETQLAEKKWIAVLKTHESFGGYNHTSGGDGSTFGQTISDEHIAKIRAAHIGVKLSDEHRAKISAALTGIRRSDEHRAKLSAAKKGDTRATHVRWHINRGIIKEGCIHCEA